MLVPKLNLHAKSLLLKHQGINVFGYHHAHKIEPVPASEFIKYLIISRQFLHASQLYKVYQFAVFDVDSDNKFVVYFTDEIGVGYASASLRLSLSEIDSLNRLLNVQYFHLFNYNHNYAEEFSNLSRIFKGHISLTFCRNYNVNKYHPSNIITQLSTQLYLIYCDGTYLTDLTKVPRLNLYFCTIKINDFQQFKRVLINHQIRDLTALHATKLSNARFDDTIDDQYFIDFPTFPRIQKLRFSMYNLNENHDLISNLAAMLGHFPNLSDLLCTFIVELNVSEHFGFDTWISRECRKIYGLLNACLPHTFVRISSTFRIRRRQSKQAIKRLIKHVLETTKFNQLSDFQLKTVASAQNQPVIQYYIIQTETDDPYFLGSFRFIIDLDTEVVNTEEDEKDLIIARPPRFEFNPYSE